MARREPRRLVMLLLQNGRASFTCQGVSRRSALKAGFLGALGLSSADLLRLQARGAAKRKNKSVILLWLDGGPSHLETYDPKPEATVVALAVRIEEKLVLLLTASMAIFFAFKARG